VVNAAYSGLLATLLLAARERGRDTHEPFGPVEAAQLSLATFALSKLVVHDKVVAWVRQPFVEQVPGGDRRPRGERLRYAVGELLTCTRCVGGWSALGLTGLRLSSPPAARVVIAVLSASAANDFLQAGFAWLCRKANSANAPAS
jgi:hypothetical protein